MGHARREKITEIFALQEEWGSNVPVTLIIVTDGGMGYGPYSLQSFVTGTEQKTSILCRVHSFTRFLFHLP
jgi:hypothetical protein